METKEHHLTLLKNKGTHLLFFSKNNLKKDKLAYECTVKAAVSCIQKGRTAKTLFTRGQPSELTTVNTTRLCVVQSLYTSKPMTVSIDAIAVAAPQLPILHPIKLCHCYCMETAAPEERQSQRHANVLLDKYHLVDLTMSCLCRRCLFAADAHKQTGKHLPPPPPPMQHISTDYCSPYRTVHVQRGVCVFGGGRPTVARLNVHM